MKKIMVIVLAGAIGTYGYAQSGNTNTVKINPPIVKKSKNKRPLPLPPVPPAPPVIFDEELLPIPPPPPPAPPVPPVPVIMEENEMLAPPPPPPAPPAAIIMKENEFLAPPPPPPPPPTRFKKGSKKLPR